jgi:hypothetical protein
MDAKAVKLENGVPMPLKRTRLNWPLGDMKKGQSFVLDGAQQQQLRMAIAQWKRRHEDGKDWSVRNIPGSTDYRCWRIA